jgi:hypothetical protein
MTTVAASTVAGPQHARDSRAESFFRSEMAASRAMINRIFPKHFNRIHLGRFGQKRIGELLIERGKARRGHA